MELKLEMGNVKILKNRYMFFFIGKNSTQMQKYENEKRNGDCENTKKICSIYWKQYHSKAEL